MNCACNTLMVYQKHFRKTVNGFSIHYPENTKIFPKTPSESEKSPFALFSSLKHTIIFFFTPYPRIYFLLIFERECGVGKKH